jgi:regulator of sigma E protease
MTLKMIGKMITGEVSLKNVTGPITIADYAGQTARMGGPVFELHRLHQHQPGCDESVTNSGSGWGPFAVLFAGSFDRAPLARADRRDRAARRVGLLLMLMALAVFNDVAAAAVAGHRAQNM